jgi:small GTP-binding protein
MEFSLSYPLSSVFIRGQIAFCQPVEQWLRRFPSRVTLIPRMQKKKICMLGSYGVGKTSLVARFVRSMFADTYQTTVGVKIDKKVLDVEGEEVTLMLWDMAGEEDNAPVKLNQVKDASGYLLVVDGTRSRTLDVARSIQQRVEAELGAKPFLVLVNKVDIRETWEIPDSVWQELGAAGWAVVETSAKSGKHVEEAFLSLTRRMLQAQVEKSEDD